MWECLSHTSPSPWILNLVLIGFLPKYKCVNFYSKKQKSLYNILFLIAFSIAFAYLSSYILSIFTQHILLIYRSSRVALVYNFNIFVVFPLMHINLIILNQIRQIISLQFLSFIWSCESHIKCVWCSLHSGGVFQTTAYTVSEIIMCFVPPQFLVLLELLIRPHFTLYGTDTIQSRA